MVICQNVHPPFNGKEKDKKDTIIHDRMKEPMTGFSHIMASPMKDHQISRLPAYFKFFHKIYSHTDTSLHFKTKFCLMSLVSVWSEKASLKSKVSKHFAGLKKKKLR